MNIKANWMYPTEVGWWLHLLTYLYIFTSFLFLFRSVICWSIFLSIYESITAFNQQCTLINKNKQNRSNCSTTFFKKRYLNFGLVGSYSAMSHDSETIFLFLIKHFSSNTYIIFLFNMYFYFLYISIFITWWSS